MTAISSSATTANWNTNGAWVGSVQPTAADDVTLVATAVITVPAGTTVQCRSLTIQALSTLAFANANSTLNIGDATSGAGNVALSIAATATITLTGTGQVNFISTTATTQTVTTNGRILGSVGFAGTGGTFQLQDALTCSATIQHSKGTLDTNSKAVQSSGFTPSASTTRVLTLGSTVWTITTPSGNAFANTTITNQTITANTASFVFTGVSVSSGTVIFGGQNYNGASFSFPNGGIWGTTGTATVGSLSFTGHAAISDALFMTGSITSTGAISLSGASLTNRLYVFAVTPGVAITLSAASVTLANVDFADITGAGAATWSGTSLGDSLGNTNITFTSPVTRYAVVAGNMSSTATWSTSSGGSGGSSVPLPQDAIIFDASSAAGTYVWDIPRMGKDVTCTGFTRTLNLVTSVNPITYGSWTLSTGMSLTFGNGVTFTFAGRGTHTITSAGKTWAFVNGGIVVSGPGGTYTAQDAIIDSQAFTLSDGTFNSNGFTMTSASFTSTSGRTRALTLGSTTWNCTLISASAIWNVTAAALTVSAASATIVCSTVSTLVRIFTGGGFTYGTLQYTVALSVGILQINGSNTFTTLNIAAGRGLTLTIGTTNTVTNLNCSGAVFGYQYFPGLQTGTPGVAVWAPNSVALQIASSITMDVKVNMPSYAPGSTPAFVFKWSGTTGYGMRLGPTGIPTMFLGSVTAGATAAITTVASSNQTVWIRGLWDDASNIAQFFYTFAADGNSGWTPLGANVSAVSTGIATGTEILYIGSRTTGNDSFTGNIYQVRIWSDSTQSTLAFHANFETKPVGTNTFTDLSVNAATITIESDIDKAGDGRIILQSSTPGTPATLAKGGPWFDNEYLTVKDITGTGVDNFMGLSSVNVSGNSTVTFGRLAQKQSMLAML